MGFYFIKWPSFENLDRNFNPIRNRVRYRNVHPSSNRIFFTIQLFQEYKNLITPGSDLYPGKVVDIKYNGKISSTFSELSSEPVIQFVTNKNKTIVFHGGPRDYEEYKIGYQVAVLYDITTDKVIWTYNVSILKIQVLVLMVISTFLLIIGQFLSMEIITDIIRDIKATRAKEYAYPEKNVRGTLSIIWENLLRKNRSLPIEKEKEVSLYYKSLTVKLNSIFTVLLFIGVIIPAFFHDLRLGIPIGYGIFSFSLLGIMIKEFFNPNRSLQTCYGLFLFWIMLSTIILAITVWI
ncbi:hypothetical protein E4413_00495 [Leptospira interrogans]|nr:hypothetical protein E4414_18425 [Leptospira interrogans]QCO35878.1 hypothetical protein E4412_00495 [Leptospira interrogans]QCO39589.1 hypothetical protein E4413_00495 [Leptospira interrogans]